MTTGNVAPETIVDKNGKITTVWKRAQPALSQGQRIAAALSPFGKHFPEKHQPLSEEQTKDLFYVVQKLSSRKRELMDAREGIQKFFRSEYMGSSAFQWDAEYDSLKRIRRDDMGVESTSDEFDINGKSVTIYFVGNNLQNKVNEFQNWLDNGAESVEPTEFIETAQSGKTGKAWWSISGDVAWTNDPEMAKDLEDGLSGY